MNSEYISEENEYHCKLIRRPEIYSIEDEDEPLIDADNDKMDIDDVYINDDADDNDENNGKGKKEKGRTKGSKNKTNKNNDNDGANDNLLPPPPPFDKLEHLIPPHKAKVHLSNDFKNLSEITPLQIFSLFFTSEMMNLIIKNTNLYAETKFAKLWSNLTLSELQIWLSIMIYTGIFKLPSIRDYWSRNEKYPLHKITEFMKSHRFEEV